MHATYWLYSSVSLFILCDLSSSPKVAVPIAMPEIVAKAMGSMRPAILALHVELRRCVVLLVDGNG